MDAVDAGSLKAEIVWALSNVKDAKALERAGARGIPNQFLEPKSFEDVALKLLSEAGVDLICLAGYMRILSAGFIHQAGVPILNVHPSLLPSFPGLHAQRQALAYGAQITGATVHLVDERVDHGPIIIQSAVPIYQDDDEDSLSGRILREEHRIFPLAVKWFAEGRVRVEGRRVVIQDSERSQFSVTNPGIS
jgi:phosphoribosylglycinamide formyltransferase-1